MAHNSFIWEENEESKAYFQLKIYSSRPSEGGKGEKDLALDPYGFYRNDQFKDGDY